MNGIEISQIGLPPHGRIACRKCFADDGESRVIGRWKMVNDPGAWGASRPEILILGFSKGFTQATAYRAGRFEDIPFKDMRGRLTETLQVLGILSRQQRVDEHMAAGETRLAFGSLVRCSLSRMNDQGRLECSGQVMPKAFHEEISAILSNCGRSFLASLPVSLRLVLMLGTTDSYIDGCRRLIRDLHNASFDSVNTVSYRTGKVYWTHISHPSGLNGHHPAWLRGDPASKAGRKRMLATEAIHQSGVKLQSNVQPQQN